MKFYIRPENNNEKPKYVQFELRLTGDRCPNLMKKQFELFFKHCGLKEYKFIWGDNYWITTKEKDDMVKDEKVKKEDTKFTDKEKDVQQREKRRLSPFAAQLSKLKFWGKKEA